MTRKDLTCVHEPFGDAFYYGPERMSVRYENDEDARNASGYRDSTYKTIFDRLEHEGAKGKRVFIKDILHYLVPPDQQPPKLAPSLQPVKRGIGTEKPSHGVNGVNGTNGVNGAYHVNGANGVNGVNSVNGDNGTNGVNGTYHVNGNGVNGTNGIHKKAPFPFPTEGEPGNPTVVPKALLDKFHFTFLIRDPHSSIPSYYRCTIPPLDDITGFHEFYPNEAGYDELRRFFDYAREAGLIRDRKDGVKNGVENGHVANGTAKVPEVCVVDADDLLDDPEGILQAYCQSVGLDFHPDMLNWDNEEDQKRAKAAFEKWKGFHEDAIDSTDLKPRTHKKAPKTEEQWDAEWKEKYGEKAARVIRKTVDDNMADYLYLKQFALKP
ncbi:hypothetical protein AYO21_05051 [Fonsecaea monophora]|uniref:P-loop containing nucleoside triphosphate hydrolase protein n=1 Tax=Fonsecaea monophora TaxID=254056 RepID=A0A177F949_9EURO|nr:hypothetical protein AYO21_05051 [Fonsecaea monophora]KAH0837563.1 hypothetical protein FOPE_05079 [Fonsecaea pedrosoi]OAG40753.1 hypothetical protein AYO21_05051 [Fonsecaea monophora]